MSDDDRTLDDAETPREPRFERARSRSGEIDVPELPSRRARTQPAIESPQPPRWRMPDVMRDGDNRTEFRRTAPMNIAESVPDEIDEELSQPLRDLSPEGERIYRSLVRKVSRAENRTMQVEAAVVAQPDSPIRKWSRFVAEKTIALALGAAMMALLNAYSAARSELNDLHDRAIAVEQRLATMERTLGAVIVPRLSPDVLQPGRPGKEP